MTQCARDSAVLFSGLGVGRDRAVSTFEKSPFSELGPFVVALVVMKKDNVNERNLQLHQYHNIHIALDGLNVH